MNRTHIDLFSGIGGFALAARWAGVETVGFAEIDDYASRVLVKNFPGVPNYGDVRDVPAVAGSTWLVTGGFPCQPFSVAGKQRGAADDRWLWPEMAGVIERVRPAWVLAENVPGIIRMELDTVLSDLESLDYTAWTVVVPAVGVDAPHRRERVWIAGNTIGGGFSGQHRGRAGSQLTNGRAYVAHAQGGRGESSGTGQDKGWTAKTLGSSSQSCNVANADSERLAQWQGVTSYDGTQQPPTVGACRWQSEPNVGRVAYGIPSRVDRLRGLGNAIVPQVAYQFIRMMIAAEDAVTA